MFKESTTTKCDRIRPLLTRNEVAEILGVTTRTLQRIQSPHGPLACIRIGKRTLFDQTDLERYLASQRVS